MSAISLKGGGIIGKGYNPYIIAEMNSSHNGNLERAKEMILSAKECGCDCVKFQSWTEDSLYSDEYYQRNPISQRIVKKFSLSEENLRLLSHFCRDIEIDFSSTPYSDQEVDFLTDEIKVPFVKISSMEINNYRFLDYIGKKGVPIILSTGMSSFDEIKDAVKTIEETGNTSICILHCVSMYPVDPSLVNLNNIKMLQKEFPEYPIGYSDHTIGAEVAVAAIATGACVIEKHFTLDNSKMGMDNNMATEPKDMKCLVDACHKVYGAMGSFERIVTDFDIEQRVKMRRSLVAAHDIKAGTVLKSTDIEAKRPGDGFSPNKCRWIIGRTIINDIKKGYKFTSDMFEDDSNF